MEPLESEAGSIPVGGDTFEGPTEEQQIKGAAVGRSVPFLIDENLKVRFD